MGGRKGREKERGGREGRRKGGKREGEGKRGEKEGKGGKGPPLLFGQIEPRVRHQDSQWVATIDAACCRESSVSLETVQN